MSSPKTGQSTDSDWSPINRSEAASDQTSSRTYEQPDHASNSETNSVSTSIDNVAQSTIVSPGQEQLIKPTVLGSRHSLSVLVDNSQPPASAIRSRSRSAPVDVDASSDEMQKPAAVQLSSVQPSLGEPSPQAQHQPVSRQRDENSSENANDSTRVSLSPAEGAQTEKVTGEYLYEPSDFRAAGEAAQPGDDPISPIWQSLVEAIDMKQLMWITAAFALGYWAGSRHQSSSISQASKSTQTAHHSLSHTITRRIFELVEKRDRGISQLVFRLIE